jgi:hypothetical protein
MIAEGGYTLGGETDKAGRPLIREGNNPDFLVHVPDKNGRRELSGLNSLLLLLVA